VVVVRPRPSSTLTAQTTIVHASQSPNPTSGGLPPGPTAQPVSPAPAPAAPVLHPIPPAPVAPVPDAPALPASPQEPPPAATPAALQLSESTIHPGGDVTATGLGCAPDAPVSLSVGDVPVGAAVAGPGGGFEAVLTTTSIDIGRHQVVATCGRTLSTAIDVVLVSRDGTATEAMAVILIFLLTGVWFFGHRLVSHLPTERNGHV
jgi:hypothetical protein